MVSSFQGPPFYFLYPRRGGPEFDALEETESFHAVLQVWCHLSS